MTDKLISKIRSFIDLSVDDVKCIEQLFVAKRLEKGAFFLEEGRTCKHVGFLVKGLVRYYINHNGEEKTYAFASENDFVCNYESFLPQLPSSKIIQALEDCEMLVITHHDLQVLYASVPQGERFGRLVIEQVFVQLLEDLSSFYTDSPERRYEQFVSKHPDLQQRVSQYLIASYVGVKPQSLSRIRRRISGHG